MQKMEQANQQEAPLVREAKLLNIEMKIEQLSAQLAEALRG